MGNALCEAEVFAAGSHGSVELGSESLVAVVFWEIEFWRLGESCGLSVSKEETYD